MKRFLFAGVIAVTACVQPPAEPPAPQDVVIRAPYDSVWQAVIAYFADTRIPISTLDKASGLVVASRFYALPDLAGRILDCGSDGAKGFAGQRTTKAYADFNVFLRPLGDSTSVRVNLGGNADVVTLLGDRATVRCVTTGTLEGGLIKRIRGIP